ncbi:toll-like receptor 6 [Tubulanus polymorphus]|uniref:toll-like receptor 6 n=1 Tax=Tubulanus polymorphus TaxID=672921 RepID=UPI003DA53D63
MYRHISFCSVLFLVDLSLRVIAAASDDESLQLNDTADCPSKCNCTRSSSQLLVSCVGKNLDEFPSVPRNTTHLYLGRNRIDKLPAVDLPELVHLGISENNITTVDSNRFKAPKLKRLVIDRNNIKQGDFSKFEMLHYLNVSSNDFRGGIREALGGLNRLPLTNINLKDCSIEIMNGDFVSVLPYTNLKELDLSKNENIKMSGNPLLKMTNLQNIDISFCNMKSLPKFPEGLRSLEASWNNLGNLNITKFIKRHQKLEILNFDFCAIKLNNPNGHNFKMPKHRALKQLRLVHATMCPSPTCSVDFTNLVNLEVLILTHINPFLIRRQLGLNPTVINVTGMKHLKDLDLAFNNLYFNLDNNSCEVFAGTSLERLVLTSNEFGQSQFFDEMNCIFRPIPRLKYLSMSMNRIRSIRGDFLKYTDKIKYLQLSRNVLLHVPHDLVKGKEKLETIKLNDNQIVTINKKLVDVFRSLPELKTIFLENNHLLCDCRLEAFSEWVRKEDSDVHCVGPPELRGKPIRDYEPNWIKCGNNPYFLIAFTISPVVLICITLTVFYVFRWDVKYFWYVKCHTPRQRRGGYRELDADFSTRRFDVYLPYSQEDSDFVMGYLRPELEDREDVSFTLCIDGRDFPAGRYECLSIVDAVTNSKWVIFPISYAFIRRTWTEFEVNQATMTSLENRRNVIILLFLYDVREESLPKYIKTLMKHVTCLRYPTTTRAQKRFWKRLKLLLLETREI